MSEFNRRVRSRYDVRATVVHDRVKVTPPNIPQLEAVFSAKPDGIHFDKKERVGVVKKNGEIAAVLGIMDWQENTRVERTVRSNHSARVDFIWTANKHRGQSLARDLLIQAVLHFGLLESNMEMNSGGDGVWKSIESDSRIEVEYDDRDEYGYMAWKKGVLVG